MDFSERFWTTLETTTGICAVDKASKHPPLRKRDLRSRILLRCDDAESDDEGAEVGDAGYDSDEDRRNTLRDCLEVFAFERTTAKGSMRLYSNISLNDTTEWGGKEAETLHTSLATAAGKVERSRVFTHFTQLNFANSRISFLDADLMKFTNLVEINVSGNELLCIAHLPQSLHFLHAQHCKLGHTVCLKGHKIECVSALVEQSPFPSPRTEGSEHSQAMDGSKYSRSIVQFALNEPSFASRRSYASHGGGSSSHRGGNQLDHLRYEVPLLCLGLAYNAVRQIDVSSYPKLVCLDLSFNELADFTKAVTVLGENKTITQLALMGNPFALLRTYRASFASVMLQLEQLDDLPVEESERQLSPEELVMEAGALTIWQDELFMSEAQELNRYTDSAADAKELQEFQMARRIQNCWKRFLSVRKAKRRKELRDREEKAKRVGIRLSIKKLALTARRSAGEGKSASKEEDDGATEDDGEGCGAVQLPYQVRCSFLSVQGCLPREAFGPLTPQLPTCIWPHRSSWTSLSLDTDIADVHEEDIHTSVPLRDFLLHREVEIDIMVRDPVPLEEKDGEEDPGDNAEQDVTEEEKEEGEEGKDGSAGAAAASVDEDDEEESVPRDPEEGLSPELVGHRVATAYLALAEVFDPVMVKESEGMPHVAKELPVSFTISAPDPNADPDEETELVPRCKMDVSGTLSVEVVLNANNDM